MKQCTPQRACDVAPPEPQLAEQCAALLPAPGVLSVDQLQSLAQQIVATPEIWQPLVLRDAHRRRYRLLYEDDSIDVWVLSWMSGQATGFHDHDVSSVGLACAMGTVVERQMLLPSGADSQQLTPGDSRQGGPGYIHSVSHDSGSPAVTIHAYSPRLERVGQYRVDDSGILRRAIEPGRQELLDSTIASIDPTRA